MKNFKLFLGLAILFAIGNAFTITNKAVSGIYILYGDTYEISMEHRCEISPGEICDYKKIGSATTAQYPDQYKNPSNFTPNVINARPVD